MLLLLAGAIGVPVAVLAYFFLKLVSELQTFFFQKLPGHLGFHGEPVWWPLPLLIVSGLLVGCAIKYLPGTAGHEPADGFKFGGGPATPIELPGIALAGLATLALGVVLGPEAPLIAIGGGLGVLAVQLAKKDAAPTSTIVIATAGSFRGDQHALRLTAYWRLPAHGSVGSRWAASGAGVGPGTAVRRHRIPHLSRAQHLDRVRHIFTGHPAPPAIHDPRRRRVRLGVGHRSRGGISRVGGSAAGPFPAVESQGWAAYIHSTRRCHRRSPRHRLRRPHGPRLIDRPVLGTVRPGASGSARVELDRGGPRSCCSSAKGWPTVLL